TWSSMCLCWAVARTRTFAQGSFSSARMTGAIFMASGRVPITHRILFLSATVISIFLGDQINKTRVLRKRMIFIREKQLRHVFGKMCTKFILKKTENNLNRIDLFLTI